MLLHKPTAKEIHDPLYFILMNFDLMTTTVISVIGGPA